jgi:hypothetical protein
MINMVITDYPVRDNSSVKNRQHPTPHTVGMQPYKTRFHPYGMQRSVDIGVLPSVHPCGMIG